MTGRPVLKHAINIDANTGHPEVSSIATKIAIKYTCSGHGPWRWSFGRRGHTRGRGAWGWGARCGRLQAQAWISSYHGKSTTVDQKVAKRYLSRRHHQIGPLNILGLGSLLHLGARSGRCIVVCWGGGGTSGRQRSSVQYQQLDIAVAKAYHHTTLALVLHLTLTLTLTLPLAIIASRALLSPVIRCRGNRGRPT